MAYQLSDEGRSVTFAEWLRIGGCGLPGNTTCHYKLGSTARLNIEALTLGEIEDACPFTGRSLARYAIDHLSKAEMTKPYESALR